MAMRTVSSRWGTFTALQQRRFFASRLAQQAPCSGALPATTFNRAQKLQQHVLQFQRRFQITSGQPINELPPNLIGRYIRFCNEHQMAAAILTSFVLWSLGDVATQKLESMAEHNDEKKTNNHTTTSSTSSITASSAFEFLNLRRLAATAFFGVSIAGIGGFYWYRLLDKAVSQWLKITPAKSGYARFTAAKLGLEFLVWHPISLAIFWLYLGVLGEGKSLSAVGGQLVSDLPTAIAADMCLWFPIDVLNFRFMPVHLQVIVVNIGSLFEAVLLSYLHGASGHGHGSSNNGGYPVAEVDKDRHNSESQLKSESAATSTTNSKLQSAKAVASSTSNPRKILSPQTDDETSKVQWL